ncbi:serine/threonine-protein kinase pim-1-like [Centropristis striata]|uniref:serine/threonine-protein kinase pim-1-like n=1 Tax=Centropristis striata TaxID=184440 RepID=UPI0027E1F00F|nr:serine/threonine-protein kinase pim-1-like [Centropristis striata]
MKRKASPDRGNPKRRRISESDPRKPEEVVPDAVKAPLNRKRRLLRDDLNDPMEGSSSDVGQRPKKVARRRIPREAKELNGNAGTDGEKLGRKRKRKAAEDADEPSQKRQRSEEEPREVSIRLMLTARAQFSSKYKQQKLLGEGGFGSVFAGYRTSDKLPVAIKHVKKDKVVCEHMDDNGNRVSVEVAAMLKLADATNGPVGTSATVSLLDWYDLDHELILVMERPVPCMDLQDYVARKGGRLQEEEAKTIMKQLVDAVLELQENHIFHRDIKTENLLIETGSDVPRVRLIDFGVSCFAKKGSSYQDFCGTPVHTPPEWYVRYRYTPWPTTAWQLGVVLFEILHSKDFETRKYVKCKVNISKSLSKDCQDFLEGCLAINPKDRTTLQQLQNHRWLR